MVAKSIAKIYTNIHKPTDYTVQVVGDGCREMASVTLIYKLKAQCMVCRRANF